MIPEEQSVSEWKRQRASSTEGGSGGGSDVYERHRGAAQLVWSGKRNRGRRATDIGHEVEYVATVDVELWRLVTAFWWHWTMNPHHVPHREITAVASSCPFLECSHGFGGTFTRWTWSSAGSINPQRRGSSWRPSRDVRDSD